MTPIDYDDLSNYGTTAPYTGVEPQRHECNPFVSDRRRWECPECGKVWRKQKTGGWAYRGNNGSVLQSLLFGYIVTFVALAVVCGIYALVCWLIDVL